MQRRHLLQSVAGALAVVSSPGAFADESPVAAKPSFRLSSPLAPVRALPERLIDIAAVRRLALAFA